jgi:hypothetical protein
MASSLINKFIIAQTIPFVYCDSSFGWHSFKHLQILFFWMRKKENLTKFTASRSIQLIAIYVFSTFSHHHHHRHVTRMCVCVCVISTFARREKLSCIRSTIKRRGKLMLWDREWIMRLWRRIGICQWVS